MNIGTERTTLPVTETDTGPSAASGPQVDDAPWTLIGGPDDNASQQRVTISAQPFKIGRHPQNHLCIGNTTVSGDHAELLFVNDDVYLRDLNSTNGTMVNGRRVLGVEALRHGDILHFGNALFTLERAAEEQHRDTVMTDAVGEALAHVQFSKLLDESGLWPCFQPIVKLEDRVTVGYELLARSHLLGLETPDKMFRVAAQRTSSVELSVVCRTRGMRVAEQLNNQVQYYVNTHPSELGTPELFDSLEQLRGSHPSLPMVLEVHEAGITSTDYLRELRERLNDLEMGLAYDDFGSGQARLMEIVEVPPDVLKFDVKFVHGLPAASPQRRSTIRSLIQIVLDLGIVPLAEGVESPQEAEICRDLGFHLAQGYLFGRPGPSTLWEAGGELANNDPL